MKIVIIGTNHAGIAAANTLLDNYPGCKSIYYILGETIERNDVQPF